MCPAVSLAGWDQGTHRPPHPAVRKPPDPGPQAPRGRGEAESHRSVQGCPPRGSSAAPWCWPGRSAGEWPVVWSVCPEVRVARCFCGPLLLPSRVVSALQLLGEGTPCSL